MTPCHALSSGGVNNMITVGNVDYYHCRYDVTLSQAGTQPQHSSGDHFDSSGAWHGNIACKLLWVVSCPSLRSDHKHCAVLCSSAATSPLLPVSRISIATVMSEQWGPNKEASGDQVCRAGPGWGLSWLTHTAASVFALYISTLLAAAAWPALLLSLNTVSWVWFGAQQSPENVDLSKLTL